MAMHAWRLGLLAGHGAEQSHARTTYGGELTAAGRGSTTTAAQARQRRRDRGRAGVDDDGGATELDAAGRGRDEIDVVDRKVEDEQRNRSIYIGQDPLVPAYNTNRD